MIPPQRSAAEGSYYDPRYGNLRPACDDKIMQYSVGLTHGDPGNTAPRRISRIAPLVRSGAYVPPLNTRTTAQLIVGGVFDALPRR